MKHRTFKIFTDLKNLENFREIKVKAHFATPNIHWIMSKNIFFTSMYFYKKSSFFKDIFFTAIFFREIDTKSTIWHYLVMIRRKNGLNQ